MENKITIEQKIEAVLFYKGEPVKKGLLTKTLEVSAEQIEEGVQALQRTLTGRGITLVAEGDTVALGTAPQTKELIESMRKEELEGPLGKAGLETLAVVMYQGPVSRVDIEYVRGVNCSAILRSLTMRGLIEKKENPRDKRGYIYQSTPELPAALGISSVSDMPDYETMRKNIDTILDAQKNEEETYEK